MVITLDCLLLFIIKDWKYYTMFSKKYYLLLYLAQIVLLPVLSSMVDNHGLIIMINSFQSFSHLWKGLFDLQQSPGKIALAPWNFF